MTARQPILVPHDGTKMSDMALEKAIEFAKTLGAELIILHVIDSGFIPPSAILSLINEKTDLENAKAQLIRILKTGAETMLKGRLENARAHGVRARFVVAIGSPAEEIVSISKAEKAEMIVVGSRQLGKMITLGSVARKVSETAECPVMIIR